MLTYQRANAITEPGRYRDDLGLYLNVAKGGSKSWILRIVVGGRRRDVGLGLSHASASPTPARPQRPTAARYPRGSTPAERRAPAVPTFAEAADAVYDLNAPTWAPHHAKIWRQSLDRHALPRLGALRVDRVTRADVLAALQPLWASAPIRPAVCGSASGPCCDGLRRMSSSSTTSPVTLSMGRCPAPGHPSGITPPLPMRTRRTHGNASSLLAPPTSAFVS